MGLLTGTLNPIRILGRQAVSYSSSVGRAGIRLSSAITKDALGHGMVYYTAGGAVIGGAAGGLDNYTNRGTRGIVGATLRGAAYGAAGGVGLRMGMSAYGMRGSRAARSFGARLGGAAGRREAMAMGSRGFGNPTRQAARDLAGRIRLNVDDLGNAISTPATRMRDFGRRGPGGAGDWVMGKVRGGGRVSSAVASAHVGMNRAVRYAKGIDTAAVAGRAYGAAQGAAYWAGDISKNMYTRAKTAFTNYANS